MKEGEKEAGGEVEGKSGKCTSLYQRKVTTDETDQCKIKSSLYQLTFGRRRKHFLAPRCNLYFPSSLLFSFLSSLLAVAGQARHRERRREKKGSSKRKSSRCVKMQVMRMWRERERERERGSVAEASSVSSHFHALFHPLHQADWQALFSSQL